MHNVCDFESHVYLAYPALANILVRLAAIDSHLCPRYEKNHHHVNAIQNQKVIPV